MCLFVSLQLLHVPKPSIARVHSVTVCKHSTLRRRTDKKSSILAVFLVWKRLLAKKQAVLRKEKVFMMPRCPRVLRMYNIEEVHVEVVNPQDSQTIEMQISMKDVMHIDSIGTDLEGKTRKKLHAMHLNAVNAYPSSSMS